MALAAPLGPETEVLTNYDIIFGPPGTGKTNALTEIIARYVKEHGPDSVMVTSFTRAAAAELVSRVQGVPDKNVRTLHSFGFAAMGGSKKVADQNIPSWNAYVSRNHLGSSLTMTPPRGGIDVGDVDDLAQPTMGMGRPDGDTIFASISVFRARMVPEQYWPKSERLMYQHWKAWKAANNLIDFGDMIEIPLRDNLPPPTNAKFFIVDEAQDCTRQQIALVNMWGRHMQRVVIALDDDQSLYYFAGGDPEACLELPIPEENQRVLPQSYRVPRLVQEHAQRWISQIPSTHRREKQYLPKAEDGELRIIEPDFLTSRDWTYLQPDLLVEDALSCYVNRGKTVMFLATCGYMLDNVRDYLRKRGVPFHNPYRTTRADWNPLTPRSGVASSQRLLAFLRPRPEVYGEHVRMWTIEEFMDWTGALAVTGVFKKGGHKAAQAHYDGCNGERDLLSAELDESLVEQWLEDDALGAAYDGNLDWFEQHLSSAKRAGMQFPLTIARNFGATSLMERPKVILGTIHSVKGAQADAVYLFPDISRNALRGNSAFTMNQMDSAKSAGKDWAYYRDLFSYDRQEHTVIRTFYVGMTRAAESLIICPPAPASQRGAGLHRDLARF